MLAHKSFESQVVLLANFLGTPEAAAEAVAIASTRVLRMFTLTKVTLPIATRIHIQDLAEFQDEYDAGKISNLSFKSQGFWSDGRKLAHKERCVGDGSCLGAMPDGTAKDAHLEKCVKGGGSERGRMADGSAKEEHKARSEGGGGSKEGRMADGSAKEEHVSRIVAKGGCERGRMAEGTAKDEFVLKSMKGDAGIHIANIAAGHEKKNALLFRLANGKKDQEHKWLVSSHYKGTACLYTFSNGNDDPIEGKGAFEEYLLKSYMSEELTEDGKSALAAMK